MFYYHFIPGAYDQTLHINRIAELKESISHLIVPQFGYNYLHGSAIMSLYPYINLIPIVLLSFLIKSKILVIYVSFSFYIFITLLISFYSSIRLSESWHVSYLFSIIYSMSLMYIDYTFVNADLSESAALTWLPLIVFGFIELIKYKTKWMELSIGISLMIGTHILSAIIVIVMLLFWYAINIKRINKKVVINTAKAITLSISTTAFIWIPLISFMINNPSYTRPKSTKIWNFAIPMSFLIKDSLIGRAIEGIGILAIIEIIMGLMFFRSFNIFEKQMFIISIITVLFCSKLFPWHYVPSIFLNFLRQFQFTTRFYIVPQLMLNYLFVITLNNLAHQKKTKNYLFIVISLLTIGFQLRQQQQIMSISKNDQPFINMYSSFAKNSKESKSYHHKIIRLNLTSLLYRIDNNKEYNRILNSSNEPTNTDYWPLQQTKKLSSLIEDNHFLIKNVKQHISKHDSVHYNGDIYIKSKSFKVKRLGFHKFSYYSPTNSEIMLPMLDYHGERFKFYDNHKIINIKNDAGMMVIKHPKKGNNIITIHPLSSYHLNVSKILTLIGLLGYIISTFIFIYRINFKKNKLKSLLLGNYYKNL